ncbi:MAG: hypothetical protein IJY12_02785 [Clostridia bacterium]|nr:hypothetical protein [Clostridia bacterium]
MEKKVPFVVKIGSKRYSSTSYDLDVVFNDEKLGTRRFDTKIIWYKDGLSKTVYCNNGIFGIHLKRRRHVWLEDEENREERTKEKYAPREDRTDHQKRAVSRIEELIMLNDFDYFLSVTFDDKKVDATDANAVFKKLRNWLSDRVKRKGLRYLLIPEYHKKNKRIHAHLLVNDVFNLVDSGTRKVEGFDNPVSLATIRRLQIPEDRIKHVVYNVTDWKYGFSTAIHVYGDRNRMKNYLLKYITKDDNKIFGKRYWFSKNNTIYPVIQYENTFGFYQSEAKEYTCPYNYNAFKYVDNMEVYNDDNFSPERISQYAEIEI